MQIFDLGSLLVLHVLPYGLQWLSGGEQKWLQLKLVRAVDVSGGQGYSIYVLHSTSQKFRDGSLLQVLLLWTLKLHCRIKVKTPNYKLAPMELSSPP